MILEQIRLVLLKKDLGLNNLFKNYDKNKDDILEIKEFESALQACGLTIPSNLLKFLYTDVFDPLATKQRRTAKITKKVLRKYIDCFGSMGSKMVKSKESVIQSSYPDDSDLVKRPAGSVSAEDEARSKISSRKILAKLH